MLGPQRYRICWRVEKTMQNQKLQSLQGVKMSSFIERTKRFPKKIVSQGEETYGHQHNHKTTQVVQSMLSMRI